MVSTFTSTSVSGCSDSISHNIITIVFRVPFLSNARFVTSWKERLGQDRVIFMYSPEGTLKKRRFHNAEREGATTSTTSTTSDWEKSPPSPVPVSCFVIVSYQMWVRTPCDIVQQDVWYDKKTRGNQNPYKKIVNLYTKKAIHQSISVLNHFVYIASTLSCTNLLCLLLFRHVHKSIYRQVLNSFDIKVTKNGVLKKKKKNADLKKLHYLPKSIEKLGIVRSVKNTRNKVFCYTIQRFEKKTKDDDKRKM